MEKLLLSGGTLERNRVVPRTISVFPKEHHERDQFKASAGRGEGITLRARAVSAHVVCSGG